MSNRSPSAKAAAVITGFGPGLGESLARELLQRGYEVAALSRSGKGLDAPHDGFKPFACDVTDPVSVARVFAQIRAALSPPRILIHNAAKLLIRDFMETEPEDFETIWRTACYGGMLCACEVLPGMLAAGDGKILFTGATASLRGGAKFSAFASAKFALRGLAQSLARQYGPKGIHVAHVVVDGVIWGQRAQDAFGMARESCLDPDALAETVIHLIDQKRSSWTHEIDVRPAGEAF